MKSNSIGDATLAAGFLIATYFVFCLVGIFCVFFVDVFLLCIPQTSCLVFMPVHGGFTTQPTKSQTTLAGDQQTTKAFMIGYSRQQRLQATTC